MFRYCGLGSGVLLDDDAQGAGVSGDCKTIEIGGYAGDGGRDKGDGAIES